MAEGMDTETLTYVLEAVDSVTPVTDKILASQEGLAAQTDKTQGALDAETAASGEQTGKIVSDQDAANAAIEKTKGALDELSGSDGGAGAAGATKTAYDNLTASSGQLVEAQGAVAASTADAQGAIDSQSISFIKNMTVMSGVHRGFGMLINSSKELGLVNDATAKTFQQMNAVVGLVSGSFMMLKSAEQIITSLRDAELGLAAVETFRSVLENPASIALVGVGIGAAAGVGAMMLTQNNSQSTTVNQQVTFAAGTASSSDQRSMARAAFDVGGF